MQKVSKMKQRYKYIVNHPNSQTPVGTFKTMKAARAFSAQIVEEQFLLAQIISGTKIYLPLTKKVAIS
jgi:hypothetical protein